MYLDSRRYTTGSLTQLFVCKSLPSATTAGQSGNKSADLIKPARERDLSSSGLLRMVGLGISSFRFSGGA